MLDAVQPNTSCAQDWSSVWKHFSIHPNIFSHYLHLCWVTECSGFYLLYSSPTCTFFLPLLPPSLKTLQNLPRSFWIWSKLLNLVTEILNDLASPNALASTVINPLSTLFVWAILNSIQQTVFKPLFLSFCCAPRARNASSTFSLLFSIPDSAPLKRLSTPTSSLKSLLCSAQKFITACLPQPSSLLLMMLLLIL